jgi:Ca-activated chloride channel family protein
VQQPISAVDRSEDLPVAVGLMLDTSGSMIHQLGRAIDTADAFIGGIMQQEQDKAFVMSFADLPAVLQQFTNDRDRLVTSLNLINSGRYTRLYDSIVFASLQFQGHEGRRALIVLSDGADSDSEARLDDAIAAAQLRDVAIYPVAVGLIALLRGASSPIATGPRDWRGSFRPRFAR